jgi:hypothetical protein
MTARFGSADREEWRGRITSEDWSGLSSSDHLAHLIACRDCQTSLFQFLELRESLDYRSHSCFDVAYYSAAIPQRCIERSHGLYSIIANGEKNDSVVIGFCPWCGITLPTGISN